MISRVKVSYVIPFYNEEGNVTDLLDKLVTASVGFSYEIIAVDDGSSDKTFSELNSLCAKIPQLKVLQLKRNFGQTAALAAGIDNAIGDIVITLDGDGQNDPIDIPRLLKKMDEGFDVVSGWRKDRKDKLISRKIPSWLANSLISRVSGVSLHDYGCTLKAYKRNIISNLQLAGEMHRFLPAWCVWQGGKVAEIPVQHHPRIRGKSKYGLMRIFKVIIDLITLKFFSGYIFKPNYLFSGSAIILFILGLLSSIWAVFDKLGPDLYPKLRIPLLLQSGFSWVTAVLLILMGLIAELLVRIYFQALKQKPYRLSNE